MLVFLIGFMGSGKTSIGKKLDKKMKYAFLDLDQEIEKQENLSISEIFEIHGEDYFRVLEKKVLVDLTQLSNTVVSIVSIASLYPFNFSIDTLCVP